MTRSQSRTEKNSRCNRLLRRLLCAVAIIGLSAALDGIGLSGVSLMAADVALAGDDEPTLSQKSEWQSRYRRLLKNQALLRDNIVKSRENHSRANRRNYPRGAARLKFLTDAEEAKSELIEIEEEMANLLDEARRDALPRNWIFEVDDEVVQLPAATAQTAGDDSGDDGRNPLYNKD